MRSILNKLERENITKILYKYQYLPSNLEAIHTLSINALFRLAVYAGKSTRPLPPVRITHFAVGNGNMLSTTSSWIYKRENVAHITVNRFFKEPLVNYDREQCFKTVCSWPISTIWKTAYVLAFKPILLWCVLFDITLPEPFNRAHTSSWY